MKEETTSHYEALKKVIDTVNKYSYIIDNENNEKVGRKYSYAFKKNVIMSDCDIFLQAVHSEIGGEYMKDTFLGCYIYLDLSKV